MTNIAFHHVKSIRLSETISLTTEDNTPFVTRVVIVTTKDGSEQRIHLYADYSAELELKT